MTAVTVNAKRPVARRAWAATLPFIAGGLIGAAATFGLTDEDPSATAPRGAATSVTAAAAGAVTVSPEAAERWALAARDERVHSCTITHRAPDAVARCLGG